MKTLLSHYLELVFTALGLIVILVVPVLFAHFGWVHPWSNYPWLVAAVTATAVGIIHGIIFFIFRRRERQNRRAVISDVRRLTDVLCNQLQAVVFSRHARSTSLGNGIGIGPDEHDMLDAAHTIRRHVADLH